MRDIYKDIKDHFRNDSEVVIARGKGAQGLKYKGKMFVMFYKGDLTVKLKPESVIRLIESGQCLPYDPGTGKSMKDRVLVPAKFKDNWIELCEQSLKEIISYVLNSE